jgi:hypothetical protein
MILLLIACFRAEVVNACDVDSAACLACEDDAACAYVGNPCTDTVYCAHEDASIAVIEIGCSAALERTWPSEDTCKCVARECSHAP